MNKFALVSVISYHGLGRGLAKVNLKVANVIAVQFGIFVGIMSWLGYSRFPSAEPRTRERPPESAAAFAPVFKPGDQRPEAADYSADREGTQPMAEQTAQAAREYSAMAAQLYYQQIAPRRYASAGPDNASIGGNSLSYTTAAQEPEVVPADDVDSPQTVAYAQPTQFIAYPVETVGFSNSRSFGNRFRSARHPATPNAITHRRPNRGGPHQNIYQVVPGQIPNTPSCPPIVPGQIPNAQSCRPIVAGQIPSAPSCQSTQGFRPRGNR
jgi:hypothetical protein